MGMTVGVGTVNVSFSGTVTVYHSVLTCMLTVNKCFSDPDSINPDTFVSQRPAFYLRMRYQIMKKGSKTKHTGYLVSMISFDLFVCIYVCVCMCVYVCVCVCVFSCIQ